MQVLMTLQIPLLKNDTLMQKGKYMSKTFGI